MRTSTSMSRGHIGSLIVTACFILAGVVTLYDTTGYSDRDSQVFPRAVAIILIVSAGVSFVTQLLKPSDEKGFGRGSWWRRIVLVVAMFLACFAMPVIGFLPAGAIAFAGGLLAAMHNKWTPVNLLLYWGSGGVIMVVFYSLFKFALKVPLP